MIAKHRPKRHYRHSSPLAAKAIRELYFVGRLKQREIGRILNGDPDYHDSWHDIIGYTKLVADRLETGKTV